MTASALEKRFDDLIARVEDATRLVEGGTLGDFEALNKEIADVCTETRDAPPEIAKALQGHMGRIILKLDELAAGITHYKDNLEAKK
jgi:hypothetical protein